MKRRNGIASRLVAGMIALALVGANVGQAAQTGGIHVSGTSAVEIAPNDGLTAESIIGAGSWWDKMVCATCVGFIYGVGGTTIVGVATVIAMAPMLAIGCLDVCVTAFDLD